MITMHGCSWQLLCMALLRTTPAWFSSNSQLWINPQISFIPLERLIALNSRRSLCTPVQPLARFPLQQWKALNTHVEDVSWFLMACTLKWARTVYKPPWAAERKQSMMSPFLSLFVSEGASTPHISFLQLKYFGKGSEKHLLPAEKLTILFPLLHPDFDTSPRFCSLRFMEIPKRAPLHGSGMLLRLCFYHSLERINTLKYTLLH